MKAAKSQIKIKTGLGKYENYLTQKNWEDPMFMDDRGYSDALDLTKQLMSYSSLTIQPRAKLSLSLHDKAGAVLSDSRKIGMLQKVQNSATRKSLSRLSNISTLPPIKTETQQVADHLRKVKNELDGVSEKSIRMQKQVSNIQASIIQTKEKSKVLHQILQATTQEEDKQILAKKQIVDKLKYDTDVRFHMRDSLKTNIQAQAKSKTVLQGRLNQLKVQLRSLTRQLDNNMRSLNISKFNKKQYEAKADQASDELYATSSIAERKLELEMNAEKLHQKLQSIEGYREDQYHHETNLENHFATLKQLRVQQVLNRMLSVLHIKHQAHYQQYEKSYMLMISYNSLNTNPKTHTLRTSTKTESTAKNGSMLRNSSTVSQSEPEAIGLQELYRGTSEKKKELELKIKEKEQKVKQLQSQKQGLYAKWMEKTFVDAVTEGVKPQKKTDYSKQIKKLIEREKRAEANKTVEKEIGIWLERQVDKLDFHFSKKLNPAEKLIKIVEYLSNESKKIIKSDSRASVPESKNKPNKSKSKKL